MEIKLLHGDCLELLKMMPDNSMDAVVTDPPYGLKLMGKKWDCSVPLVEVWAECLRALKPGGHLLAFAGTRTQHRMAVNIEDAGFEIRDMIAWVYGSGFPKSLDVSKAIDRMDASDEQERRRLRFTAWVRSTGATARQIDAATGTNMGGHYTTAASQPAIMTREHLEACRHLLGDIPDWVEREADIRSVESRNMADREVLGVQKGAMSGWDMSGGTKFVDRNITAPATEAARQWEGWGTALKPALEPITVARKPLGKKTVAANVLEHGTGALNIDGCRVETNDNLNGGAYTKEGGRTESQSLHGGTGMNQPGKTTGCDYVQPAGRWPANLIHDGSEEVADLLGSAARFFYCPKASKADRDEGCEELEVRTAGECTERTEDSDGLNSPRAGAGRTSGSRNFHPTVKPTDLMRYLCRLVTPPGGTVLDPFMGSGSTGKAAVLEGFGFVGMEREAEYIEIAQARIGHADELRKETE